MCRRPEEGWHLVELTCRRHSIWFFVKWCQPNTNTGNIVNPHTTGSLYRKMGFELTTDDPDKYRKPRPR